MRLYVGKGFLWFKRIGYLFGFLAAIVACALVFDYMLEINEQEEKNRVDALIAAGYIRKMPALKKQYKNLEKCDRTKDSMVCEFTENGILKRVEIQNDPISP